MAQEQQEQEQEQEQDRDPKPTPTRDANFGTHDTSRTTRNTMSQFADTIPPNLRPITHLRLYLPGRTSVRANVKSSSCTTTLTSVSDWLNIAEAAPTHQPVRNQLSRVVILPSRRRLRHAYSTLLRLAYFPYRLNYSGNSAQDCSSHWTFT